jgi:hypothetical protein
MSFLNLCSAKFHVFFFVFVGRVLYFFRATTIGQSGDSPSLSAEFLSGTMTPLAKAEKNFLVARQID